MYFLICVHGQKRAILDFWRSNKLKKTKQDNVNYKVFPSQKSINLTLTEHDMADHFCLDHKLLLALLLYDNAS